MNRLDVQLINLDGSDARLTRATAALQAAGIDERGEDVDEFDDAASLQATVAEPRIGDHKRNVGIELEVGRLRPQAMFAEMEAVITHEHDDRVGGPAGALERVEVTDALRARLAKVAANCDSEIIK